MVGHYLLLVTLCCSLFALMSTAWLNVNLSPYLHDLAQSVPSITIEDGKASVDVEQPHYFRIEGEVVAVIDTTRDPKTYLDEHQAVVVLSEDRISCKDSNGKVEYYELTQDFSLNSAGVTEGVAIVESWFLPAIFILCFLWQVFWKAFLVLLVAGVTTLLQSSRPDFGTHLKLATLALGPALAFNLVIFAVELTGIGIPASSVFCWLIVGGLTYAASDQLRKSPTHS